VQSNLKHHHKKQSQNHNSTLILSSCKTHRIQKVLGLYLAISQVNQTAEGRFKPDMKKEKINEKING
jgi:hypothetical protein